MLKIIRTCFGNIKNHPDLLNIIKSTLNNINNPESIIYVLGKENYDLLMKNNVNKNNKIILMYDKDSFVPEEMILYNKIHIIKNIEKELKEFILLDWDCIAEKKIDNNFYDILRKKEKVQGNLTFYGGANYKAVWRKKHQKVLINSGFLYVNNLDFIKQISDSMEYILNNNSIIYKNNDELVWSHALDKTYGDLNPKEYWNKFEPDVCNLSHRYPYTQEQINSKIDKLYFTHYFCRPFYKKKFIIDRFLI